jgi:hypothetical protein
MRFGTREFWDAFLIVVGALWVVAMISTLGKALL